MVSACTQSTGGRWKCARSCAWLCYNNTAKRTVMYTRAAARGGGGGGLCEQHAAGAAVATAQQMQQMQAAWPLQLHMLSDCGDQHLQAVSAAGVYVLEDVDAFQWLEGSDCRRLALVTSSSLLFTRSFMLKSWESIDAVCSYVAPCS